MLDGRPLQPVRPVTVPESSSRPRARLQAAVSYAGFGSAVDHDKVEPLVNALRELWSSNSALPGHFVDLGCGDGRVVIEVARALKDMSRCSAAAAKPFVGVDLQAPLIERAKALAKDAAVSGMCEFRVGDLASVDLSGASIVFLYFPPVALPSILAVLASSNLRNGATVVSADGAWRATKAVGPQFRHNTWGFSQHELDAMLQPSRVCWGKADIFFYTWRGNAQTNAESEEAEAAKVAEAQAASQAAAARIKAKREAEQLAEREAAAKDAIAKEAMRLAWASRVTRPVTAVEPPTNRTAVQPAINLGQLWWWSEVGQAAAAERRAAAEVSEAKRRKEVERRLAAQRKNDARRFAALSLKLSPYGQTLPPLNKRAMRKGSASAPAARFALLAGVGGASAAWTPLES